MIPNLISGSAISVPSGVSEHRLFHFTGRVHVLPEIFDHYTVGLAMPQGSPLREPVNRALLKIIDTDDWLRLKERYIGSGR